MEKIEKEMEKLSTSTNSNVAMINNSVSNQPSMNSVNIKKKGLDLSMLYRGSQSLVSNFYNFSFDVTQEIYLYSIMTEHKIQKNYTAHYGLIKRLNKNKFAREYLKKYFDTFFITGNSLFAENKQGIDNSKVVFKVVWVKNELKIFEATDTPEKDTDEVYTVTIERKFKLADCSKEGTTRHEREHVKQFMNIVLQKMLEQLGYIRTEPGVKAVYYKKGLKNQETIQLSDSVYFVFGYKLNTNFYENNQILIKTVQKFRMIRNQSYFDYYAYLANDFKNEGDLNSYFSNFMKNRIGLTKHTERRVKATSIKFGVDLSQYMIKIKVRGQDDKLKSMAEYYLEKYNYKIQNTVQPLVEQEEIKKGFGGKKITQVTHYPLEILYILGKLDDDKFDIAKAAIIEPTAKFEKTHFLMKELKALCDEQAKLKMNKQQNEIPKSLVKNTQLNFTLKTIKSNILTNPEIEFGNKKYSKPDEVTGVFDMKQNEPLENKTLSNWIIFTYDVFDDELAGIGDLFRNAKTALGIDFNEPLLYKIDPGFERTQMEEFFKYYFNSMIDEYKKNNKIKELPEVAMLLISKKKEFIYQNFKNALNSLDITIRSQVVKKESIMKKGLTVAGNILLQIWAKRDFPLWKSKDLKKLTKTAMICGYSITSSTKTKGSITSLCATVTPDSVHFANFCMFHENTNKLSTKIGDLLEKAVEIYMKLNEKKPDFIILYREGTNEKQREKVVKFEIQDCIKRKELLKTIPLTLIFVNKQCDLRFFKEDYGNDIFRNKNNDMTNLETTSISLTDKRLYTNARPGTVIDAGVTLCGANEYYIISSYSQRGTCNPTHYYVELDEAEIDKNALFKITYDLTYLYFNNQKCIRLPVPLHNASRMGQMASKNLTNSFSGKFNYNFGY